MKSNLSLKLFLAFERYFIENDEVISLDKSSEFTDVIVGIGFLPQDMSENTDFKKKTLEKYGFFHLRLWQMISGSEFSTLMNLFRKILKKME